MTIQLYDLVGEDTSRPFSPHCWKVKMALAHKGLEFQSVPTTFLDVPKVENGFGKTVPIIRDGDIVVSDSFKIALYLDETYPEKPSLFDGEGGKSLSKFVESWCQTMIHPTVSTVAVEEIGNMLGSDDQEYFIPHREGLIGKSLSTVTGEREEWLAEFPNRIKPLGHMLRSQPFFGGESPIFADYIVFGAFQWARICSVKPLLPVDHLVMKWFERCLELHDGLGRKVGAASLVVK
ncbi:glutathione S-transferase family protein [Lentilitoribacter sp. Alg239-R112]|uniref:glutathione S-transferase family protein n=1 Tax=Lentilitoribacter sp. Alg239-R112 TaxID=2305987 RepID=UPI0013A709AA|nr:glutathione S-transferase family protein [Lentilitoribacter sp. Alg239-R112]